MTSQPVLPVTPHVPAAALDASASRALGAARGDLLDARALVARALDVDWLSRAATAYGGRVDDVLAALDAAARLLQAAVVSAQQAESVARLGLPPVCLPGGLG